MSIFLKNKKSFWAKKILAVLLIVCFSISITGIPQKVESAELPVTDPANTANTAATVSKLGSIFGTLSDVLGTANGIKDFLVDKAGWILAKMIIRGIMQSTIQWINNGFQGNPLYIANPEAFFRTVADQALGEVLSRYLPQICEPFQINIRKELLLRRASFDSQIRCTLSDAINNIEGFVDGTRNQYGQLGGWREWNIMYTDTASNPYGASLLMGAKLSADINAGQNHYQEQLTLGDGFLNLPEPACAKRVEEANNGRTNLKELAKCNTVTPGHVIAYQLDHTLGLGNDSLVAADEIGEVVDALISQLTIQLLTGNGLAGLGGNSNYSDDSLYGDFEREQEDIFLREKNVALTRITAQKTLEGDYATAKERTSSLVNPVITAVSAVRSCYNGKIASNSSVSLTPEQRVTANERIATASSTINDLGGLMNNLLLDRDTANINIRNLQLVQNVISATTYPRDINRLSGALADEARLRGDLHSAGDLTVARNEEARKNPYNNNLEEITTTWNTRLTELQVFPLRVPPTIL